MLVLLRLMLLYVDDVRCVLYVVPSTSTTACRYCMLPLVPATNITVCQPLCHTWCQAFHLLAE